MTDAVTPAATEQTAEDLTIADGVPFAAHMLACAIKFIDGHRERCGKSYDLAGVRDDLVAALTALPEGEGNVR